MSSYISFLTTAIQKNFGCSAVHIDTKPVKEVFQGKVAWEGDVEIFMLSGHSKAAVAYAWSFIEHGQRIATTVLGIPPVNSPEDAVKVAISSKAKRA